MEICSSVGTQQVVAPSLFTKHLVGQEESQIQADMGSLPPEALTEVEITKAVSEGRPRQQDFSSAVTTQGHLRWMWGDYHFWVA